MSNIASFPDSEAEMTDEEASAACIAAIHNLGKLHARRIMHLAISHDLNADQVEKMVQDCLADARSLLFESGVNPRDADAAIEHIYFSLIKEGARLSRIMVWDHGHA